MRTKWILPVFLTMLLMLSCAQKKKQPSADQISDLQLKKGQIITCGPPGMQFGTVAFETSCNAESKKDFELAVSLLHSFEYDEAEKAFATVIEKDPACAMAYWGVAMSNFHPLWSPPTGLELEKGSKAVQVAQSLSTSKREKAYIDAIAAFYTDWQNKDHFTRCNNFEKGMERVHNDYPEDKEASIFYALSLVAAADPKDQSFANQKKAGQVLANLYPQQPDHPGIAHYLIHTYDYPGLAEQGLSAARKYAAIAPSSAHALHMPSHIFTRLGLWDDCIQSNLVSVSSARCYAEAAGIKGHWDEELHGLDYLVYAYLQKGMNDSAKMQVDYVKTITETYPTNFKVAYSFAAVPARYALENHLWNDAANLSAGPANFPWNKFPWQEAIIHFTRSLGAAHIGNLPLARKELEKLTSLHDTLTMQKDDYKANQVAIQMKSAEAWILLKEGKQDEALAMMQQAADMEDNTEKHPVTPGEVIPARELLGDMLMQLQKHQLALQAYEVDLKRHPNRLNGLLGAAKAAELSGNVQAAKDYFQKLTTLAGGSDRTEVQAGRLYVRA